MYTPPVNDFQDQLLDEIITDLQTTIQEENYEDLADEFVEAAEIISGEVLDIGHHDAVSDVTPSDENTSDDDKPLYEGFHEKGGGSIIVINSIHDQIQSS